MSGSMEQDGAADSSCNEKLLSRTFRLNKSFVESSKFSQLRAIISFTFKIQKFLKKSKFYELCARKLLF
jgi:hypothetical protein